MAPCIKTLHKVNLLFLVIFHRKQKWSWSTACRYWKELQMDTHIVWWRKNQSYPTNL